MIKDNEAINILLENEKEFKEIYKDSLSSGCVYLAERLINETTNIYLSVDKNESSLVLCVGFGIDEGGSFYNISEFDKAFEDFLISDIAY